MSTSDNQKKQTFKCDFCLEHKEKVITLAGKKTPSICYDCAREAKKLIDDPNTKVDEPA